MKSTHQSLDRPFMELAIDEMAKSVGNGPKVGAVLVVDNHVVARGHRSPGIHAERSAISDAVENGINLKGATLYSTLEPCVNIGSAQEACASLIARSGISTIVIGRYDTNPRIYREGWKLLRDSGIKLRDFDADLRRAIDTLNATFAEHFVSSVGPTGGARFDYQLNGGNFAIQYSESDERSLVTRWTLRSGNSIYANAIKPSKVALARHAREFSEVDDPTSLNFDHYAAVQIGEVAAFVLDGDAILVKVVEVHGGPTYGSDHTSVKIEYEVRARK